MNNLMGDSLFGSQDQICMGSSTKWISNHCNIYNKYKHLYKQQTIMFTEECYVFGLGQFENLLLRF